MYDIVLLQDNFSKGAEGKSEEQFIKESVNTLIYTWLSTEKGAGEYRLTGGYWESLYPILQKHAPEKLKEYESILPENFEVFNDQVKELYNYGNDLHNLLGALQQQSDSLSEYRTPKDPFLIDLGNDEIIAYLPNTNIDQNQYWGREL